MKRILAWILVLVISLSLVPADQAYAQAVNEPEEEQTEEDSEESAEEPSEEPAEEPSEEPAEEPSEEPAEEPSEEPVEEPSEEPAKEPSEEPAEKSEEEPSAVSAEEVLNYIYIDYPEITEEDVQNIAVSVGADDEKLESAVLTLQKGEDTEEVSAEAFAGNAALFIKDVSEEVGVFQVLSMEYTVAGERFAVSFSECDMKSVSFTVGEADAASQIETEIVVLDEEISENTEELITEAIGSAQQGVAAPMKRSAYSLRSTRSSGVVVVLDPGHDDTHGGAQASGYGEEDLTLKIAKYCEAALQEYAGITTYLTRNSGACPHPGTSSGDCNTARVQFAQSVGANVYVSFHLNSALTSSADGAEVYYPNDNYVKWIGDEGEKLADKIQDQLAALGLRDRGIKIRNSEDGTTYADGSAADYYNIIKRSKEAGFPGIIIEHAFLTNSSDVNKYLSTEAGLKSLGEADAKGIAEYFGLSKGIGFTQCSLNAASVVVGQPIKMTYAVNDIALITADIYDGNDIYLKNIMKDHSVGPDVQNISWDLKGRDGEYVADGTYRITISATDINGKRAVMHKWFEVTGNPPVSFKWVLTDKASYKIGETAHVFYAVDKNSAITVKVYRGDNTLLTTLVTDKSVKTNDQVVRWDLKDSKGNYVKPGTYRFTVGATDAQGNYKSEHRWIQVEDREPLNFKWTILAAPKVTIGNEAHLYYALTRDASVTIKVYDGNDRFLKTLVQDKKVKTNDQHQAWDLTNASGDYVANGTYRFSINAVDDAGKKVTKHLWFTVEGNEPIAFKWTILADPQLASGETLNLFYGVNQKATISADVYYGNNTFLKRLVSGHTVGTNDQVIRWDLTDRKGDYVPSGLYRITLKATSANGQTATSHIYFHVETLTPIMGDSAVTVAQMVKYYNKNANYPSYYKSTEASTIEKFCQIYYEECAAEGVKAEVAFCQAMKETNWLRYTGDVSIEQFNFAGIGATGNGVKGNYFETPRIGIRAQVQHLKAYATTEPLKQTCVDPRYKYVSKGCAAYVEWLGIQENPAGKGWAAGAGYGPDIIKRMANLKSY